MKFIAVIYNYTLMYYEKILKILYYILLITLLYFIYKISIFFIEILVIYFLTIFFSIILKPIVDWLEKKYKLSTNFSSLIIIFLFFGIVITLFTILIPSLYYTLTEFAKTLQENLVALNNSLINIVNKYLSFLEVDIQSEQIIKNILNQINQNIPKITEKILEILLSSSKIILNIILVTVLTFYHVKDYEKIKKFKINIISKLFSIKPQLVEKTTYVIEKILRKFLLGQIFAASYIFLFTLISLKIFNVKQYLIVATIAGIFELIPFIGAFIAFFISIIFLLNKGFLSVILFIILATIAYQILAKIIYPNIVGKILKISVISVLLSIIIGFKLYGIFGMFIAVPLASIIKNIIEENEEPSNKIH